MNPKVIKVWEQKCPEMVKLAKRFSNEPDEPVKRAIKRVNDAATLLNRWGDANAHTAAWMEADALARVQMGEEFARVPTQDFSKPDPTTLAVQKQAHDDDFVLDQGCSTGQTDRLLREQDRETIAKAHGEASVSLRSEYLRRDSRDEFVGPLDMGFAAVSNLDR